MEGGGNEIESFIKVWITAFASLTFCYFIIPKIPKGILRLLSLLPIISLFTFLPLNLSSIHLVGITSFLLTWLSNFKLLLLAFNQGPLSSPPPISLVHFISIACLPIQVKQQNHQNSSTQISKKGHYAIKALLLALVIKTYDYKYFIHPNLILSLYCCHVYLALEIVLFICAVPARAMFGFEIEPQFNEPYKSTSLQDFWGRRWNLMVTTILRPTVYLPVRGISTRILGRKWALVVGSVTTFVVSGLMHELIYFYMSRVRPSWEVTWFFVLHGICTALEIVVKKSLGDRWQLQPVVSGVLTVGFVGVTGFWLFFAQIVGNELDARAIGEYGVVIEFMKSVLYGQR